MNFKSMAGDQVAGGLMWPLCGRQQYLAVLPPQKSAVSTDLTQKDGHLSVIRVPGRLMNEISGIEY